MANSKLLYIAFRDFSKSHQGSLEKIKAQCRAFAESGYDVTLVGRLGDSTISVFDGTALASHGALPAIMRRAASAISSGRQCKDIVNYLEGKQFDCCYIRYDFSSAPFIEMLSSVSKHCKRVAVEFPTWPYDGELRSSLPGRLKLVVDKHYRKSLNKFVGLIVSFYETGGPLFGVPVVVVPNGYDFDSVDPVTDDLPTEVIHVAAISSMREWHGYERFIEGLGRYYAAGGQRDFVLHLVGDGPEKQKYMDTVSKYQLEHRVVFEGAKHGDELDRLLGSCILAIDSLARHRSGIDVLSSLKSREYGAKGIPFINSCRIDVVDEGFPYMLKVPANEDPIDIEAVETFVDALYENENRKQVAGKIRSYFEERCGMRSTLKPVVDWYRHDG